MALNGIMLQAKMLQSTDSSIDLTQGTNGHVNFKLNLSNFVTTSNINITATDKAIALAGTSLTFNTNVVQTAANKNVANGIAGLDGNVKLAASQIPVDGSTLVYDSANGVIKLSTIKVNNTYSVSAISADIPSSILDGSGSSVAIADIEVGDQMILTSTAGGYAAGTVFIRLATTTGTITADFAKVTFNQSMDSMTQGTTNFFINSTQHAVVSNLAQSGSGETAVITHGGVTLLKTVAVSAEFTGSGASGSPITLASGGIAVSKLVNTTGTQAPSNWEYNASKLTAGTVHVDRLPVAATTKGIVSIATGSGLTVSSGALSLNLALKTTNSFLEGDGKAAGTGLGVKIGTGLTAGVNTDAGKIVVDTTIIATKSYVEQQAAAIVSASYAPIDFTAATLTGGILTIESPIFPRAIVKKTVNGELITYSNLTPIFPDTITDTDENDLRTFTIDLNGFVLDGTWQVMF